LIISYLAKKKEFP